jgi:hypothetical protein
MGKINRTATETMGLSKTAPQQGTPHREPMVQKQEMLGNT